MPIFYQGLRLIVNSHYTVLVNIKFVKKASDFEKNEVEEEEEEIDELKTLTWHGTPI